MEENEFKKVQSLMKEMQNTTRYMYEVSGYKTICIFPKHLMMNIFLNKKTKKEKKGNYSLYITGEIKDIIKIAGKTKIRQELIELLLEGYSNFKLLLFHLFDDEDIFKSIEMHFLTQEKYYDFGKEERFIIM